MNAPLPIAVPDATFWVPTILSCIGIGLSSAITIVLFRIQRSDTARQSKDDRSQGQMDELAKSLQLTTAKLIDERIRGVTHELQSNAQSLVTRLEEARQSIVSIQNCMGTLTTQDHSLELKVLEKFNDLRDTVFVQLAQKSDLEALDRHFSERVDVIDKYLKEIGEKVAGLAALVQRNSNRMEQK